MYYISNKFKVRKSAGEVPCVNESKSIQLEEDNLYILHLIGFIMLLRVEFLLPYLPTCKITLETHKSVIDLLHFKNTCSSVFAQPFKTQLYI